MKLRLSTFQKINIIAITIGIITFFIPLFMYTIIEYRLFYIIELNMPTSLSTFTILIAGLFTATLSTILSFKGVREMCLQYFGGILIIIATTILLFYLMYGIYYGMILGFAPFTAYISGFLLLINASTEIKNYDKEELILPKEIILGSLLSLLARSYIFEFFFFMYIRPINYLFLTFYILRGGLDVILVFGARSVFNQIKNGGYICLISISLMIIIDIGFFIISPKITSFIILWVFFLIIPVLFQLNGSIKSFRESLSL